MSIKDKSFAPRFWSKVNKTRKCWEWTAAKTKNGYGRLGLGGRSEGGVLAHRASWMMSKGKIPKGLDVAHRCNNKCCVRPSHLYLATRSQNMLDAIRDGIFTPPVFRGEAHGNAKLTERDVKRIRATPSGSLFAIAKRLGISGVQACNIKRRDQWRHVA